MIFWIDKGFSRLLFMQLYIKLVLRHFEFAILDCGKTC
jgi:hypothetical protein